MTEREIERLKERSHVMLMPTRHADGARISTKLYVDPDGTPVVEEIVLEEEA